LENDQTKTGEDLRKQAKFFKRTGQIHSSKSSAGQFREFLSLFCSRGKRINFYSMKECGDKAAAELTALVRAAAGTSRMSIARKPKSQGSKYRQKKTGL
jgi:hypothetical protein